MGSLLGAASMESSGLGAGRLEQGLELETLGSDTMLDK
jgi:hypothetical protein